MVHASLCRRCCFARVTGLFQSAGGTISTYRVAESRNGGVYCSNPEPCTTRRLISVSLWLLVSPLFSTTTTNKEAIDPKAESQARNGAKDALGLIQESMDHRGISNGQNHGAGGTHAHGQSQRGTQRRQDPGQWSSVVVFVVVVASCCWWGCCCCFGGSFCFAGCGCFVGSSSTIVIVPGSRQYQTRQGSTKHVQGRYPVRHAPYP
mmetsp:Transcript_12061/g.27016  ORF Transcript_12061/g.27016 Transcript_12061/m.27016 type:complete len:206 (-) Transcript_12061:17-634(-)